MIIVSVPRCTFRLSIMHTWSRGDFGSKVLGLGFLRVWLGAIPALVTLFCIASFIINSTATADTYSPYAAIDYPDNLYWGDTHLHTNLSLDANFRGNENMGLEEAYRVAQGEVIRNSSGEDVALIRPLDFLVISDHAENLGVIRALREKNEHLMSQPEGTRWLNIINKVKNLSSSSKDRDVTEFAKLFPEDGMSSLETSEVVSDAWRNVVEAADRFNDPGKFTAFIAYEWTSTVLGNNLHRVVIFEDGGENALMVRPFSAFDSEDPEDLWEFMRKFERKTGGRILAIPHNGNISNGLMFDTRINGKPITTEYAKTRSRWEPLYEVTQIKGDAETHPYLSPNDPFADYETWDSGNLMGNELKNASMLKHEYARSALMLGLSENQRINVNPFKFGFVGGSDAHTGIPAVREENYMGKFQEDEPSAERATTKVVMRRFDIPYSRYAASGYTAVWAQENTRESLFNAMLRRETYATTGPRMVARFFGGWDFEKNDHLRPDYATIGYTKGVPMGGDLASAPEGQSPAFLIVASKDPDGANLERVQIIKGWLEENGDTREKVYDVALSDGRQPDQHELVPSVQSTVDVTYASYTNSVGDVQLSAVWRDPDFDRNQSAFFYVRTLEIFTPRWTTYDGAFYGNDLPSNVPAIHQERAYTSPIWYTP